MRVSDALRSEATQIVESAGCGFERLFLRAARDHRRYEAEHDARKRGVRSAPEQAEPQECARKSVGIGRGNSDCLQSEYRQDAGRRDEKTLKSSPPE